LPELVPPPPRPPRHRLGQGPGSGPRRYTRGSQSREDPSCIRRVLPYLGSSLIRSRYGPHICGLGALGPVGEVELHFLVRFAVPVPRALDRAEVHEDVGASLLGDETETLLRTEPLDCASGHEQFPPLSARSNLPAVRRPPAVRRM